ncbi:mannosyl-oligosaccharide 1,2-alpha-mannosidase [Aureococcus anophagefferens]|nr:mannosyl-oligosaccharide 1,2-alpha-mannosidase [Aureococcus anophagefferens]
MLTIGDYESFAATLDVIAATLTFDRDVTVSTFEACIRVLGGLLSAHYLVTADALRPAVLRAAANATDPAAAVDRWARSLRSLATDLGRRLLPAFDTPTGIPAHRVNLRRGVATSESRETRGAARRRALAAVKVTDLVGSTVHTHTGQWLAPNTGVGAGVDSYYEYMVKAAIFLDDAPLLHRGLAGVRAAHNETSFRDPASALLWNVEVYRDSGRYFGHRVSALQAFWPSLLLMAGDVGAARDTFKAYWSVWRKYKSLPELFDLSRTTC